MKPVVLSRGQMFKRALTGENTWLIPTSRAKLLKAAVTPKSTAKKRSEAFVQELASGSGKAAAVARWAAGGAVAYLTSKALQGGGSVLRNASQRRIQSAFSSDGSRSTRQSTSGGGNRSSGSSARKTAARKAAATRKKTTARRKSAARKAAATRKKNARKKTTTPRKTSTGRKKATARRS
jgi:hypothetical protein